MGNLVGCGSAGTRCHPEGSVVCGPKDLNRYTAGNYEVEILRPGKERWGPG
jgi:hypothetical protein